MLFPPRLCSNWESELFLTSHLFGDIKSAQWNFGVYNALHCNLQCIAMWERSFVQAPLPQPKLHSKWQSPTLHNVQLVPETPSKAKVPSCKMFNWSPKEKPPPPTPILPKVQLVPKSYPKWKSPPPILLSFCSSCQESHSIRFQSTPRSLRTQSIHLTSWNQTKTFISISVSSHCFLCFYQPSLPLPEHKNM